ncbi:uncharacterized protein LOC143008132 [Genypterus blacodes]|uniref:uncharacterized protein LOC143008132 n=1 Tax=Genypterus blacodes TaxID=154954 RepID=UPI003F770BA2
MWVPELRWGNKPCRNHTAASKHPRLKLPVTTCTWPPRDSRWLQRADTGGVYVSFVSPAVLWDRGLCSHTVRAARPHGLALCPRFLSHMKVRPADLRPARLLSTESRPQPPSLRKTHQIRALPAPRSQSLAGRRVGVQDRGLGGGRHTADAVQENPPPSTINPTLLPEDVPHDDSGGQRCDPKTPPCLPHLSPEGKEDVQERERRPQLALEPGSSAGTDRKQRLRPDGPEPSASPTCPVSSVSPMSPMSPRSPVSRLSDGSLSDFSRPPSSLFSRSTDLASGRSSVLSAGTGDLESVARPSEPPLPSVSRPLAGIDPHPPPDDVAAPPLQPLPVRTKPLSRSPDSGVRPHGASRQPQCDGRHTASSRDVQRDASTGCASAPSSEVDHGLAPASSPSATWSSCPSPQRTVRSEEGPSPSSTTGRLKWVSERWPVLPPISPVRGRCRSTASHYSELSCSQSYMFDELEAIAPPSSSRLSLDLPLSSVGCPTPDSVLSPGLATLTVGCDSGKLGSLSRVRLLLLDRPEPETLLSPHELSPVQDWSTFRMQYNQGLNSGTPPLLQGVAEGSFTGTSAHGVLIKIKPLGWIINRGKSEADSQRCLEVS